MNTTTLASCGSSATPCPMTQDARRVSGASPLGTVFTWHDFYQYGPLAAISARHVFRGVSPSAGVIFALRAFAARVFGRSLSGFRT